MKSLHQLKVLATWALNSDQTNEVFNDHLGLIKWAERAREELQIAADSCECLTEAEWDRLKLLLAELEA